MTSASFLTGQFLLATPGMADPRFDRSVIFICAHDENGAMGLNIAAVADNLSLGSIFTTLGIDGPSAVPSAPIYLGGPVEREKGFVLHSLDIESDSMNIAGQWGLSSSVAMLRAIAHGRGPGKWVMAMGYAGWGSGQLENELTQNGWSTMPADDELLYETEPEKKWHRAWEKQGIDPSQLSHHFGSA